MRSFAVALLSIMAACVGRPAFAQDCSISFTLTAAAQASSTYLNLTGGCTFWAVTYSNTGFSALSLEFQSAPNASGAPGTWVPFAGTVVSGANPNTAITQAESTFSGYYPFLRILLDTVTGSGTVKGTFYGWREKPSSGGSVPTPLPVEGCGPVGMAPACDPVVVGAVDQNGAVRIPLASTAGALAASLFTGATYETDFTCASQAAVALTASGLTQIVALTAAQVIRVCHVSMAGDAAVNVKFSTGTGSNCGTGTADLTGLYYGINTLALDFSNHAALRVPSGQALCVSLSGAANWGGVIVYAKY